MSVSPDSSVSQCDVNSLAVDSRPSFPFEVFTQLDSMSPSAVLAVQSMYETYCQACVSVAQISQLGSDGSGGSSGATSSASSRPNRRQRRRASMRARSRGSSSMSQRSAVQTVDFPVGYCYLALIKAQFRSAVAADLGFNPALSDLARLPVGQIDLNELDRVKFDRVSSGRWHCGSDGLYTVRQVMSSLRSVYCTVVGTFGSNFESSAELQVSLSDRLGFLAPAVSLRETYDWVDLKKELCSVVRSASANILVYSLENSLLSRVSALQIDRSTLCRAQAFNEQSSCGYSVARFEVTSQALTVAKCPKGFSVELNGMLFGSTSSSVFVTFKGFVSFAVRCPRDYRCVDVPFLVRSRTLSQVIERFIPVKSTSARFFRDQGGTAVLRGPISSSFDIMRVCREISITDPLQESAIQEDRLQGDAGQQASSYLFQAPGWQALTAFRTEGSFEIYLNKFVQVCDPSSIVILNHTSRLDVSEFVGRWSVRRRYVADEYLMDGGGLSDTDFSDAL